MEQFNLAEYLKNPNRKIVTRDGRPVRIICTDRKSSLKHPHPIVALVQINDTEPIYDYTADGSYMDDTQSLRDLFFVTEKQESPPLKRATEYWFVIMTMKAGALASSAVTTVSTKNVSISMSAMVMMINIYSVFLITNIHGNY